MLDFSDNSISYYDEDGALAISTLSAWVLL